MQIEKYDIVVIGSGMAGVTAALTAVEKGKNVAIVARAPGATALSTGLWDICGDPLGGPHAKWDEIPDVKTNIAETIARNANHPYALLTGNGVETLMAKLTEAVSFVQGRLASLGLHHKGDPAILQPAPTALGTWKLSSMSQTPQHLGVPIDGCAVVGVKKLEFPGSVVLAGMLKSTIESRGVKDSGAIDSIEIDMDLRRPMSVPEFYEHLAVPGEWERFTGLIAEAGAGRHNLFLIPPAVPFHVASTGEEIKVSGDIYVREIIGTPQTGGGIRLAIALGKCLEKAGVTMIRGDANGFASDESRVSGLTLNARGESRNIEADRWILASGKYIGGGIAKGDEFSESVFGLPLFANGVRVERVWTKNLLGQSVLDRHAVFSAGLRTDSRLRPVNAESETIYENLFAAGSILGGYNYNTDGCGLGICALTGRLAGVEASK